MYVNRDGIEQSCAMQTRPVGRAPRPIYGVLRDSFRGSCRKKRRVEEEWKNKEKEQKRERTKKKRIKKGESATGIVRNEHGAKHRSQRLRRAITRRSWQRSAHPTRGRARRPKPAATSFVSRACTQQTHGRVPGVRLRRGKRVLRDTRRDSAETRAFTARALSPPAASRAFLLSTLEVLGSSERARRNCSCTHLLYTRTLTRTA